MTTAPIATQVAQGAIAMAPLFFGLATHGLCIRHNAVRSLARPIASRLFGANKTYRGIACVAAGTSAGFVIVRPGLLQPVSPATLALIGLAVGAVAMAAELPNSFLKRRAGIGPGTQARGARGAVFHVLDQVDVVFGAWAVLAWVATPSWARFAGSLGAVYVGHQVLTLVGYWLGMRSTAR